MTLDSCVHAHRQFAVPLFVTRMLPAAPGYNLQQAGKQAGRATTRHTHSPSMWPHLSVRPSVRRFVTRGTVLRFTSRRRTSKCSTTATFWSSQGQRSRSRLRSKVNSSSSSSSRSRMQKCRNSRVCVCVCVCFNFFCTLQLFLICMSLMCDCRDFLY